MAFALSAPRIFDGQEFYEDSAVIIEGRRIAALLPKKQLPPLIEHRHLDDGLLAPGFIDLQVNGGGGVLFNACPTIEGIRQIFAAHRSFGTVALLPTVVTDAPEVMRAAIASVREARRIGEPGIPGIHVEGPFLDPRRKGAHAGKFIRLMTEDDIAQLVGAGTGRMLLTVAPDRVSPEQISALVRGGVVVSLGHSEATSEEAIAALGAGATCFTHLFNAMSQMTGREPGMVGVALADEECYCGMIADGFHVHDLALRTALAAKRKDRIVLVSDAMPPAAGGPGSFELQGRTVRRMGGRLELEDGTLAGSNLTMAEAVRYCVGHLKVELADALAMASRNPAACLGMGEELGRIAPGYLASLVHLGDDLSVRATWVEGR
jgi:N-acetylglucosamine-6-phosphate deacetylase